jgi:DNA-binding XRE family transcriptional regulator
MGAGKISLQIFLVHLSFKCDKRKKFKRKKIKMKFVQSKENRLTKNRIMGGQRVRDTGIMAKFGHHLRSVRLKKQLTQEELGYKANISTSQVARIEAGKLNTTISTVISLARAMEVDPSDFFESWRVTGTKDSGNPGKDGTVAGH